MTKIVVYGGRVIGGDIEYCILEVSDSNVKIQLIPYSTGSKKKRYSPTIDKALRKILTQRRDYGRIITIDYNSVKDVHLKRIGKDELMLEIVYDKGFIIIHYPYRKIEYLKRVVKSIKKHIGLD